MRQTLGTVYLVGAGPGDPGLITVRGFGVLRRADVILHDRLVSPELLASSKRDAEIIYVGKVPGGTRTPQGRINELLLDHAREGKTVVRLKGGDPFLFGRGYEEFAACRDAGVPCVVIPGVSSALAAPLAAGIPVTARLDVRSVGIITGSFAEECQAPPLDYAALARLDTLIVMMGLAPLEEIASSLVDAGREPGTPAASIENATTPQQRIVRATLGTIAQETATAGFAPPVLTVIGAVAVHAGVDDLAGYSCQDDRANRNACQALSFALAGLLTGRRFVITRPSWQGRQVRRALARAGAEVIECPMIAIDFNVPSETIDEAIRRIGNYDWVVFTSTNGVQGFFSRLTAAGKDARALAKCKLGVVGPASARALQRQGLRADVVPTRACADGLADGIIAQVSREREGRVLFACGDRAMRSLPDRLGAAGMAVDEIIVYRTLPASPSCELLDRVRRDVDAVLFYSPSAVARFVELGLNRPGIMAICFGPTTEQAAKNTGFARVVRIKLLKARNIARQLARIFLDESP